MTALDLLSSDPVLPQPQNQAQPPPDVAVSKPSADAPPVSSSVTAQVPSAISSMPSTAVLEAPLPPDRVLPQVQGVQAGQFAQTPGADGKSVVYHTGPQRNVVDFKTFDIERGHHVSVQQASVESKSLFQVTGQDPSIIRGKLDIDQGHVFLSNANGIYFSKDAVLDIAKLTAIGGKVDVQQFLTRQDFKIYTQDLGHVFSAARVTVKEKGLLSLIGKSVTHTGHVVGHQMVLAAPHAGYDSYVTFMGADHVGYKLSKTSQQTHNVQTAAGGRLASAGPMVMTVDQAESVMAGVVHMGGTVEAKEAEGDTTGASIILKGEKVSIGADMRLPGGAVVAKGSKISIQDNAVVDVSGIKGNGGQILLGDHPKKLPQGQTGVELTTDAVFVAEHARLVAEARNENQPQTAGKIQLYAEKKIDPRGQFSVANRGKGDAGYFELSVGSGGRIANLNALRMNLSALQGQQGTFELDPDYISIYSNLSTDVWNWSSFTGIENSTLQGWLTTGNVMLVANIGIGFQHAFSWGTEYDLILKVTGGILYLNSGANISVEGAGNLWIFVNPDGDGRTYNFSSPGTLITNNNSGTGFVALSSSKSGINPWQADASPYMIGVGGINKNYALLQKNTVDMTGLGQYNGVHLIGDVNISSSLGSNPGSLIGATFPTTGAGVGDVSGTTGGGYAYTLDYTATGAAANLSNLISYTGTQDGLFTSATDRLFGFLRIQLAANVTTASNYGVLADSISGGNLSNILVDASNGTMSDVSSGTNIGGLVGSASGITASGVLEVQNFAVPANSVSNMGGLFGTVTTASSLATVKITGSSFGSSSGNFGTIIGNRAAATTIGSIIADEAYNGLLISGTGGGDIGTVEITGPTNLNQDITTTGAQTYGGAVTLGGDVDLDAGTGNITFSGTVDGSCLLVLTTSGATTFTGDVGATERLSGLNLSGAAGTITLNSGGAGSWGISVTGEQTYGGAVTLGGDVTLGVVISDGMLQSSTVTLAGVTGNNHDLTITGDAVLNGTLTDVGAFTTNGLTLNVSSNFSNLGSITVNSAFTLNQDITTTVAQTYNGTVTLGGNVMLTSTGSSTITLAGVTGNNYDLTITGDAVLNGTLTDVGAFTTNGLTLNASPNFSSLGSIIVNSAFILNQDITTTGAQTYGGEVTLDANRTLTGSTVTLGAVTGGNHNLTIAGNGVLGGAFTNVVDLSVNGTTALNTNITTSGTQTYSGAVTLGGDVTLAAGSGDVTFNNTVDSDATAARSLTVATGGTTTFTGNVGGGNISSTTKLLNLDLNGATGDIILNSAAAGSWGLITTGAQTYGGAVTLGGDVTLAAGSGDVTFNNTVDSDATAARSLTVATGGTTTFTGVVGTTALAGLDLTNATGIITLNQDITTTGAQTYGGAVTLGGNVTLTSTTAGDITFGSTVDSDGTARSLTVATGGTTTFTGIVGSDGSSYLSSLDISNAAGTITLYQNITTTGTQMYSGAVTLGGNVTLTTNGTASDTITFSNTVDSDNVQARSLTVTADTTFNGAIGGTNALSTLTLQGEGVQKVKSISTVNGLTFSTGTHMELLDTSTWTSNSGDITVDIPINGAFGLTLYGNTVTLANVGTTIPLQSLTVEGNATLNGAIMTTTGAQSYNGTVTVSGNGTTLAMATTDSGTGVVSFTGAVELGKDLSITTTNSNVTFSSTVDSVAGNNRHNLTLEIGSGTVDFQGDVGITTNPLKNLITNAGSTALIHTNIKTIEEQHYNGTLKLAVDNLRLIGSLVDLNDVDHAGYEDASNYTLIINGDYDAEQTGTLTNVTVEVLAPAYMYIGSGANPWSWTTHVTISADDIIAQLNAGNTVLLEADHLGINADLNWTGMADLILKIGNESEQRTGKIYFGNKGTPGENVTITTAAHGNLIIYMNNDIANAPFELLDGATAPTITTQSAGAGVAVISLPSGYTGGAWEYATGSNVEVNTPASYALERTITYDGTASGTRDGYHLTQSVDASGSIDGSQNGMNLLAATFNTEISENNGVVQVNNAQNSAIRGFFTYDFSQSGAFEALTNSITLNTPASRALPLFSTVPAFVGYLNVVLPGQGATINSDHGVIAASTPTTFYMDTVQVDGVSNTLTFGTVTNVGGMIGSVQSGNYAGTLAVKNLTLSGGITNGGGLFGSATNAYLPNLISRNVDLTSTAENPVLGSVIGQFGAGAESANAPTINAMTVTQNLNTARVIGTDFPADRVGSFTSEAALTLNQDITTTGAQTYGGAVTLGGDVTLAAGTGDIAFNSTVDGTQSLTISTTGTTTFTGVVGATNALSSLNLSGATGEIVLAANGSGDWHIFTTGEQTYGGAVKLSGVVGLDAGTGNIRFQSTVDSVDATARYLGLTTTGTVTFSNNVGSTHALNSLTFINTQMISLGGNVTTSGLQDYPGPVVLTGDVGLTSTANENITIDGAITSGNGSRLTINNGTGSVFLNSTVGEAGNPLGLLNLAGTTGVTTLGGDIYTTGTQTYTGEVTLGGAVTLTGADITLNAVTGNSHNLTITGDAVLSGAVDSVGDFSVSGTTGLNNNVTTSGTQTYTGAVTLGGSVTLTSTNNGNVLFSNTVDGAHNLTVTTGGTTTFTGVVGTTPLSSLNISNMAGIITLNGLNADNWSITTTGVQTYGGPVTLGGDVTLTSTNNGNVLFSNTVDSDATARSLTVATGGTTTFTGVVGTTPLSSLNISNMAGIITLNSGAIGSWSITTTGAQTYGGAVTLGGDVTLTSTGSGNITFDSTVDSDSTARSLTVATGGTTTFAGGNVGGISNQSTTKLLNLDLSGATGDIVLAANGSGDWHIFTTGVQTYGGPVTLARNVGLDADTGNITFRSRVDSVDATARYLGLTTTGTVTFEDTVGSANALNSLTFINTTTISLGGNVTTSGLQDYPGPVVLTGDVVLTSTDSGNITIDGAISTENGSSLTINNGTGSVFLNSTVGEEEKPLGLLNLTGTTGVTTLGGNIYTTGAQTYVGVVTLGGDVTLTSTNNGNVLFSNTVDSDATARSLTVATGGTTTFAGVVGTTALAGLDLTNATGIITLNQDITTTGTQTYGGSVTLGGDVGLIGSTITLNAVTGGNHNLTIAGDGILGGAFTNVGNLSVSGTTALNSDITTTGTQTYTGAVTLGGDVTLAAGSGAIAFNSTVDGAHNLTVTTGGTTTFTGVVGTTPLSSLNISNMAGIITLNGLNADNWSITTTGAQTYSGPVTLGGDVTLAAGSGDVRFNNTVASDATARSLTVATGGTTTFTGNVGGVDTSSETKLLNLDLSGATGQIVLAANGSEDWHIFTTGEQTYGGSVTLGGAVGLDAGTGNITFQSMVDSVDATERYLGLTTTGTVTFEDTVGSANALNSLTFINTTTISLGGNVTTVSFQNYPGAVTLGGDVTLTGTTVTLNAVTGGNHDLTISGDAVLNGTLTAVGAFTTNGLTLNASPNFSSLGSIIVNSAFILNQDITTTGAQTYVGAVTLAASNVEVSTTGGTTADTITFSNTVDSNSAQSPSSLIVNSGAADTELSGVVGGIEPLTSLILNGTAAQKVKSITTKEGLNFSTGTHILLLDTSVWISDMEINVDIPINANASGFDLTLNTNADTGNVTLANVGTDTPLRSLTVEGNATLNGTDMTTAGAQSYSGAVSVSGDGDTLAMTTTDSGTGAVSFTRAVELGKNLSITTSDSNVTFGSTVDSVGGVNRHDLTLNIGSGTVDFQGAVGLTNPIKNLTTNLNSIALIGTNIKTIEEQHYNGILRLKANNLKLIGSLVALNDVDHAGYEDASNYTLIINGDYSAAQTDTLTNVTVEVLAPAYMYIGSGDNPWSWTTHVTISADDIIAQLNAGNTVLLEADHLGINADLNWTGMADLILKIGNESEQRTGKIYFGDNITITTADHGNLIIYMNNDTTEAPFSLTGSSAPTITGSGVAVISLPSGYTGGAWSDGTNIFTPTGVQAYALERTTTYDADTPPSGGRDGFHLTQSVDASASIDGSQNGMNLLAATFNTEISDNNGVVQVNDAQNSAIRGFFTYDFSQSGAFENLTNTITLNTPASMPLFSTLPEFVGYVNVKLGASPTVNEDFGALAANTPTTFYMNTVQVDGNNQKITGDSSVNGNLGVENVGGMIGSVQSGNYAGTLAVKNLTLDGGIQVGGGLFGSVGNTVAFLPHLISRNVSVTSTSSAATDGGISLGSISGGYIDGASSVHLIRVQQAADTDLVIGYDTNGNHPGFPENGAVSTFVSEGVITLKQDITTTGTQTYTGEVTLDANRTLTGSTVTLGAVTGGNHNLTIAGNGVLGGAFTNVVDLSVNGTTALNSDITTTGTQTYTGEVTLDANRTLTGSAVTLGAVTGGNHNLTIAGNGVLGGAFTNVVDLSVNGTTALNSDITTTGTQTYGGPVTLDANRTLTGSAVTLGAVTGGNHNLTITGDAVLNGSVTDVAAFTTNGLSFGASGGFTNLGSITVNNAFTLDKDITTTGNQLYSGEVTLGGAVTLTGTTVTLNAVTGGGNNLTIAGNGVLGGAFTNVVDLSVNGTTALNSDITTTGTQTYTGEVTLDANRTLTGSAVTLGAVTGGNHNLTIAGNGVLGGAFTNVVDLSVNGTTALNTNITTSGTQTYGGAVTLGGDVTLTGTDITLNAVTGGGNSLSITNTGDATLGGALSGLSSLSISGASTINASTITTSGTQTYSGAVTLGGDVTLTSTNNGNVLFSNTVDSDQTTARSLTVATGGTTTFTGVVGTTPLSSLNISNMAGIITLNGLNADNWSITTTGAQTYGGAVTLGGDVGLIGSTITLNAVTGGGTHDLTITGDAVLNGLVADVGNLSVSGTTALNSDITTTGTQTYGGEVTLDATRTLTGSAVTLGAVTGGTHDLTITGDAVLNGLVKDVDVFTTNGLSFGANGGFTNLGSLTVNTTAALSKNITTEGFQSYTGAVTLSSDVTLVSQNVVAGYYNIFFDSTVNGAHNLTLTTPGTTTFTGNVGGNIALESLTISGTGDITLNSGAAGSWSITTTGAQTYSGAVTLGGDVTLTSTNNGNVLFSNTVDSDATARSLTVATGGTTTFTGNVGGTTALAGLDLTNEAGDITLNNNITTSGTQTYSGPVTLGGDVTLTSTNNGNVLFSNTVDSDATARSLTVNTLGTTTFTGEVGGGNIGSTTKLLNLDLSGATGEIVLAANGSVDWHIFTTGDQTYGGAVTLGGDVTLESTGSGAITFNNMVDGIHSLTLTTAGRIFTQLIGSATKLSFLNITGLEYIKLTNNISTSGAQSYGGPVVLGANVEISAEDGSIVFGSTINGDGEAERALVINGSTRRFVGKVGETHSLSSLTLNGTGAITLNSGAAGSWSITTTGAQTYGGAVTLGGDVTLAAGTGDIAFQSTVDSDATARSLTVTTTGTTTFTGNVGGDSNVSTTKLLSLDLSGATGEIVLAANGSGDWHIFTTGAQTYGGPVTLGGVVGLDAGTGNITFQSTVDSVDATKRYLGLTTTGTVTFADAVGSTNALSILEIADAVTANLAGNVTTVNFQDYPGPVVLTGDVVLTSTSSGNITIDGAISTENGSSLTISNGTGSVFLNSTVGEEGNLLGLLNLTGTTGVTTLGGNIYTTGAQTYGGPVKLVDNNVVFTTTDSPVTFNATVYSQGDPRSVTVNSGSGDVTFTGAVGGTGESLTNALSKLTINTTGALSIGANVTTNGAAPEQSYTADAITMTNTPQLRTSQTSFSDQNPVTNWIQFTPAATGNYTVYGESGPEPEPTPDPNPNPTPVPPADPTQPNNGSNVAPIENNTTQGDNPTEGGAIPGVESPGDPTFDNGAVEQENWSNWNDAGLDPSDFGRETATFVPDPAIDSSNMVSQESFDPADRGTDPQTFLPGDNNSTETFFVEEQMDPVDAGQVETTFSSLSDSDQEIPFSGNSLEDMNSFAQKSSLDPEDESGENRPTLFKADFSERSGLSWGRDSKESLDPEDFFGEKMQIFKDEGFGESGGFFPNTALDPEDVFGAEFVPSSLSKKLQNTLQREEQRLAQTRMNKRLSQRVKRFAQKNWIASGSFRKARKSLEASDSVLEKRLQNLKAQEDPFSSFSSALKQKISELRS